MKRHAQQCSSYPKSMGFQPMVRQPVMRQIVAFLLASSILMGSVGGDALAQVLDNSTARPVHGQISISREVAIAPTKEKVSLSLRDADVKDVLQMLAKQGKFNLMLDEEVGGALTVDISNVSINKALEYIFTMMDLSYVKDGNTVMVAKKATVEGKNMAVRSLKTIPVQYKSAVNIANQLNNTIFRVPRSSGSAVALAAADPDSNSLLIMGTDADIKLVGDALRELDVPRNRKVYHIQHNLPGDVAQVLAANFFRNNPSIAINTSGGSASTASAGGGASSAAGGSSSGGSSSGGSSSGSSGGSSASSGSSSGSSSSGSSSTGSTGVSVSSFTSDGVTFISEPVSSTLTVLGTEEQIALIDSVIDQVDVQRAQVAIEVALVEIANSDRKSFLPNWSTLSTGTGLLNLIALDAVNAGQNTFTLKNPFIGKNGVTIPTSVHTDGVTIQHTNRNTRSKVLANPTMVTIDGQAVSINISDSVASITTTTNIVNNVTQVVPTITQQQAGVTVTLTPKIYNDGSVVMNGLTPTVTQPSGTLTVGSNSVTLLSTRTMTLAGVRVKDGETLIIGGLLKEATQVDSNKVPGLDKLPILGAMFRAINQSNKDKTELVLMVTPHILKDDSVSYFKNANSGKFSNMNYGRGGIVPVSLPKFMGPQEPSQVVPEAIPVPALPTSSNKHGSEKSLEKTAALPQVPPAPAKVASQAPVVISLPAVAEISSSAPAKVASQAPVVISPPAVAQIPSPAPAKVASQVPKPTGLVQIIPKETPLAQAAPIGVITKKEPLNIGPLLQSARIEIMSPNPVLTKGSDVTALKVPKESRKTLNEKPANVTNVYRFETNMERLNSIDEILK